MNNTEKLLAFIRTQAVGTKLEIATSEYASNNTPAGHCFAFHSSAQAVRSLIKQGYLSGEYLWRYYDVEVIKHGGETK